MTKPFDLHLDRWSKIFTIVLGVLGFFASVYVTIWVVVPAHKRDNVKSCLELRKSYAGLILEASDDNIAKQAEVLASLCDETVEESLAFLKSEATKAKSLMQLEKDNKPNIVVADNKQFGFVSLGKASDYQTSNFRDLASGGKAIKVIDELNVGSVLQARWSVNLRENNKDTESGENKRLLVIKDEQCVALEERPKDLRGSYWVRVSLSACELP